MKKHSKILSLTLAIVLLALLALVASGPYRTLAGIDRAVAANDFAALERHVDFPALQRHLQAKLQTRLEAEIQQRGGGNLGDISSTQAARLLAEKTAGQMASPAGLSILLQGKTLQHQADAPLSLQSLEKGFDSPSRFHATARAQGGEPVVFILQRRGLRWQLSGIELP